MPSSAGLVALLRHCLRSILFLTLLMPVCYADVRPSDLAVVRAGPSGFATVWLDLDRDPADERQFLYGFHSDRFVAGDWNGNGSWNVGVVRFDPTRGLLQWLLDTDEDPNAEVTVHYGLVDDIPITGDWDSNGTTNIGVVRRGGDGQLQWLLDFDNDEIPNMTVVFGLNGDVPVLGDWTGDGVSKAGIVRTVGGLLQWHLSAPGWPGNVIVVNFGVSGDVPVVGDWDLNGRVDIGVFRNGTWHLDTNLDGLSNQTVLYGLAGDRPLTGRWARVLGRPELTVPGVFNGYGSVAFGEVAAGPSAPARTITVRNDGSEVLQLGEVSVPLGFAVAGGWGGGRSLVPGASAQFDVRLDTATPGNFNGQLSIASNDADENPFQIALSGLVRGPEISVAGVADGQAAPVILSTIARGTPSTTRTFTVHNTGNATLGPLALSVPAPFTVLEGLPASLAPGATDAFTIGVDSYFPGTFTRTIQITSNDWNEANYDFPMQANVLGDRAGPPPTELGVMRAGPDVFGTVWLDLDRDAEDERQYLYGFQSDQYVSGDWNGDGHWNVGVVRYDAQVQLLQWLLDTDEEPDADVERYFGLAGDIPVAGDWDLDGRTDIGVVRGGYGDGLLRWFLNTDADPEHELVFVYGRDGDAPLVGDWNDDGITDIGVFRRVGDTWHWLLDTNGTPAHEIDITSAMPQGTPVVGDWDRNGRVDIGVFRDGTWYLDTDLDGVAEQTVTYGLAGDRPLVGRWPAVLNRPELTIPGVVNGYGSLAFGESTSGSPAPTRTVIVRNDGGEPLQLGAVSVPAGFSVVNGWGDGAQLIGGASMEFAVQMNTSRAGTFEGSLSIPSNDADENPFTISLSGRVVGPELDVVGVVDDQATVIDFGTVSQGDTSPSRSFTLVNNGNAVLILGGLALPSGFALIGALPKQIQPGHSVVLTIRLTTGTPGTKAGRVVLTSNDFDEAGFGIPIAGAVTPGRVVPGNALPRFPAVVRPFDQLFNLVLLDRDLDSDDERQFLYGLQSAPGVVDATVAGDWDADGRTNIGVVRHRPSDGLLHWLLDLDEDAEPEIGIGFGLQGDIPVVGDWDGDGSANVGVVRGGFSDGLLHWLLDTDLDPSHEKEIIFGLPGDIPVVGDWDGDGVADVGVVRDIGDGLLHWYLNLDGDPGHEAEIIYGLPGDIPVVGDWDDDGRVDVGVVRDIGDGFLHWYLDTDSDPSHELEIVYGLSGDVPLTGFWGVLDRPEITVPGRISGLSEVQFADAQLGAVAPVHHVEVRNDGLQPLVIGPTTLPPGFGLDPALPEGSVINSGELRRFGVKLLTGTAGQFSGELKLASNDADENPFVIRLSGRVLDPGQTKALSRDGNILRYDGKPIKLVGYGDYGMLSESEFGYEAFFRDVLEPNRINLVRIWINYHWTNGRSPYDYAPGSTPEQPKYLIRSLNPQYFDALGAFVRAAEDYGIIVQVTLFDSVGLEDDVNRFRYSPYNVARNETGSYLHRDDIVAAFNDANAGAPLWDEVHLPVINKVVDTLRERGNVIYEVMNEPLDEKDTGNRAFHAAVVAALQARLVGAPGSQVISANVKPEWASSQSGSHHRALYEWAVGETSGVDVVAIHVNSAGSASAFTLGNKPVIISNDGDDTQCNHVTNGNPAANCSANSAERASEVENLLGAAMPAEHTLGSRHFEFLDKGLNGTSWLSGDATKAPDYNPRMGMVDQPVLAKLAARSSCDSCREPAPRSSLADLWNGRAYFRLDDVPIGANVPQFHFLALERSSLLPSDGNIGNVYHIAPVLDDGDGIGNLVVGRASSTNGVDFATRSIDFGLGPPGSYYERYASFPSVWRDAGGWVMVFEGAALDRTSEDGTDWDKLTVVMRATSADGINWAVDPVPILDHRDGKSWEASGIGTPFVFKEGGLWYVFYHGFSRDGDLRVGLASGASLTDLKRQNGADPVLVTSDQGWDDGTIGKRSIVREGSYYYMVYEGSRDLSTSTNDLFDTVQWSSGVARSRDLLHWEKLPNPVLPLTGDGVSGVPLGFGFDGPEWVQTSDGRMHIYFRLPGNVTRRATLTTLPGNPVGPGPSPPSIQPDGSLVFEAETALSHLIGSYAAQAWEAHVDRDPPGFLSYGPYTRSIEAGEHVAVFRISIDDNIANNHVVVTLDVYDADADRVLVSQEIRRRQFANPLAYQDFEVPFTNVLAGNRLEFRIYWHDRAFISHDSVTVRPRQPGGGDGGGWVPGSAPFVFEAERDLAHLNVGRLDSDGWSANVVDDQAGYLSFGPYTSEIPSGAQQAGFRLLIDNNSADDLQVVTLDVYDATADRVLESRVVRRREFSSANRYEEFWISFQSPGNGHRLEFRTYWHGIAYVRQDHVRVTTDGATRLRALAARLAPDADAGGPYSVASGQALRLDASASQDPDPQSVLDFTWDINGDGIFGDAQGEQPNLSAETLATLGISAAQRAQALATLGVSSSQATYQVQVRVTDDSGAVAVSAPTTLRVQPDGLELVTVLFKPGLNLFSYPFAVTGAHATCTSLLEALGASSSQDLLIGLDPQTGNYRTCGTGNNADFPIVPGEAYMVDVATEKSLELQGVPACDQRPLASGLNLRGHPAPAPGLGCYEWLTTIGVDQANSIQRFESSTGRFESCAFDGAGDIVEPIGDDFPIVVGEGYLIWSEGENALPLPGCP